MQGFYSVNGFTFSDRDSDSEILVTSSGKRFHITMSADTFKDSPPIQQKYLHYLKVSEEYELDGLTVEDFYDWAMVPFLPLFRALPLHPGYRTLHAYFSAEILSYTLRIDDGKLIPVQNHQAKTPTRELGVSLPRDVYSAWPVFDPRQVGILGDTLDSSPSKVVVDGGTTRFFKSFPPGDTQIAKRELKTYRRIQDAKFGDNLRISRLHGLVRDDSGLIMGLLLSYIDCGQRTLGCAVHPDTPVALREKWARQLTDSLNCLHAAEITWGDVKPENVLIDKNQDAWIIDFGGGFTEGWVDREIAGTIQGDLQGFAKIQQFISNGTLPY